MGLETKNRDQLLIDAQQMFALISHIAELPKQEPIAHRHQQHNEDKAPAQPGADQHASKGSKCFREAHFAGVPEVMISDSCFCRVAAAVSASTLCSNTECNAWT